MGSVSSIVNHTRRYVDGTNSVDKFLKLSIPLLVLGERAFGWRSIQLRNLCVIGRGVIGPFLAFRYFHASFSEDRDPKKDSAFKASETILTALLGLLALIRGIRVLDRPEIGVISFGLDRSAIARGTTAIGLATSCSGLYHSFEEMRIAKGRTDEEALVSIDRAWAGRFQSFFELIDNGLTLCNFTSGDFSLYLQIVAGFAGFTNSWLGCTKKG